MRNINNVHINFSVPQRLLFQHRECLPSMHHVRQRHPLSVWVLVWRPFLENGIFCRPKMTIKLIPTTRKYLIQILPDLNLWSPMHILIPRTVRWGTVIQCHLVVQKHHQQKWIQCLRMVSKVKLNMKSSWPKSKTQAIPYMVTSVAGVIVQQVLQWPHLQLVLHLW